MTGWAPLVSVVVPARNSAAWVRAAVDSALGGTYEQIEVVVADDGSTDETVQVVEAIADQRVRLIPGGPSNAGAARNRAIREARGDLLAFLDADDLWYPRKLERQLIEFDDERVLTVGALFRFRIGARAFGVRGESITPEKLDLVQRAWLMPLTFSSVVVRRDAVVEVGMFDEALPVAADLDLLARLAQRGGVVVVEELLGEYRIHPGGISRTGAREYQRWIRFIEARTAARVEGGDLSLEAFDAVDVPPTRRERLTASAARSYTRAGVHVASRQPARAAVALLLAFVRDPAYTVSKLRRQRIWRRGG